MAPLWTILARLLVALGAIAFGLTAAVAQSRVALVIGNDAYAELPVLQKAVNDARAVGTALEGIGFRVLKGENLDRRGMNRLLADFEALIQPGDKAFVFFAGHGVAIRGENILLAVDMPKPRSGDESFVRTEGYPVDELVRRVQVRGTSIAVFVIDACRDNPLALPGGRSIGAGRGLGRPDAPEGVLLLHSASPGEQALDRLSNSDPDPNSVFTRKLVPLLRQPGLGHLALAKQVQREVRELARSVNHAQFPDYVDRVLGEIVLNPVAAEAGRQPPPAAAPPPPADPLAATRAAYEAAERLASVEAWDAFLRMSPPAPYADFARAARAKLVAARTPAVQPPAPEAPRAAQPAPPPGQQTLLPVSPTLPAPGRLVPLKLYWGAARLDNFTTATAVGERDALAAGYYFARTEGFVFATAEPGTVPLMLYWSPQRGDNFTTATSEGQRDALAAGYGFARIEGHVYPAQRPGTVPLKLFWHAGRGDNFVTATPEGERDARAAGYQYVRIEGWVLAGGPNP